MIDRALLERVTAVAAENDSWRYVRINRADCYALTALASRILSPDAGTIETVARALCVLDYGSPDEPQMDYGKPKVLQWQAYIPNATAAIASLAAIGGDR